jgi:hypothetical protein
VTSWIVGDLPAVTFRLVFSADGRKLRNSLNRFSGKSRCNSADDIESDILAHVSCNPDVVAIAELRPTVAGRNHWRTHSVDPANAAKNTTPLTTLFPRHYHARIVGHYPTNIGARAARLVRLSPDSDRIADFLAGPGCARKRH